MAEALCSSSELILQSLLLFNVPVSVIGAATRENRSSGVPTRCDTNRSVQSQEQARYLKFWL